MGPDNNDKAKLHYHWLKHWHEPRDASKVWSVYPGHRAVCKDRFSSPAVALCCLKDENSGRFRFAHLVPTFCYETCRRQLPCIRTLTLVRYRITTHEMDLIKDSKDTQTTDQCPRSLGGPAPASIPVIPSGPRPIAQPSIQFRQVSQSWGCMFRDTGCLCDSRNRVPSHTHPAHQVAPQHPRGLLGTR